MQLKSPRVCRELQGDMKISQFNWFKVQCNQVSYKSIVNRKSQNGASVEMENNKYCKSVYSSIQENKITISKKSFR